MTCGASIGPIRIGVKFSSPTTPPFLSQLQNHNVPSLSVSPHRLVTGNEPSFSDRLCPLQS
ncbi:unnamed protein product [Sphenostylis stenocarpa]|uniref:Uncharacterized protein n=1 Tax=Sphenostylis stenocarpa TaxID=92480 RepID=A0AA86V6R2_9FABA|nr:unnamed protein product [Sphenostylis stenocarpa]